VIRPATGDDIAAITALETSALGGDAWSEGLVREGVNGRLPTVHYLVADDDGVIAHAVASIVGDIAELQRIAVAADARRRGIATDLLAAVEHEAAIRHADRLLLEVREDNEPALKFYAARGFAELDRRTRYYADGTTAVVLVKEVAHE
jgi:[ribosomal protein S18]-alanine N-acetyltransferase